VNGCIANLHRSLPAPEAISSIEILSLAAVAIKAAEGLGNPFQAVV
jgi:hypothetical protein